MTISYDLFVEPMLYTIFFTQYSLFIFFFNSDCFIQIG